MNLSVRVAESKSIAKIKFASVQEFCIIHTPNSNKLLVVLV